MPIGSGLIVVEGLGCGSMVRTQAHADFLEAFGAEVRRVRRHQGLTQEGLAELAGMHATYVAGIERGERNPSIVKAEALANALGVSLADLLRKP